MKFHLAPLSLTLSDLERSNGGQANFRGPYLYINNGRSGRRYLWHIPSTFATVNTHANVFFVFLPGGISKEWRHIVSTNCHFHRQYLPCLGNVYGPFGQELGDPQNSSRES